MNNLVESSLFLRALSLSGARMREQEEGRKGRRKRRKKSAAAAAHDAISKPHKVDVCFSLSLACLLECREGKKSDEKNIQEKKKRLKSRKKMDEETRRKSGNVDRVARNLASWLLFHVMKVFFYFRFGKTFWASKPDRQVCLN